MFGLSTGASRKLGKTLHGFVTILSSVSIIVSSVSASYGQQIIVDPSAPGTSFLQTGNGTPQVNIATPQSGVSLNRFETFNVDQNGLVLNNSTTNGVSVIGRNVTANPNLMVSGPASTIVGEVTSAAPSTLTGTTEVFGQSAAVVIANPNGISCNGCAFLNSASSTLTTGRPVISGSRVDLLVTRGTVTIGPDGFAAGRQAGVFGRHVIVDGPISTDGQEIHNSLIVSGGAQRVRRLYFDRLDRSNIVTAPTTTARTSPFAVDISDSGTLTGGVVSVKGAETGQGVNIYGDVESRRFRGHSRGDLFYKNVDARFSVDLLGQDVRQYGDLNASGDVTVGGTSFTLYDGRLIETPGDIDLSASEFVVIAGEVSGEEIHIDVSTGSLTNTGFLMADGELTILAGEDVSQQRGIPQEYDIYFDPALQQYLQAYYAQLITGGEEADIAAEMIARASRHEIIAEYIDRGATTTGTNVTVTATNGDVTNTGGAIAATNDVRLTAGADIINTYLALRSRLDAEDGCSSGNCGYRTDFHAGEILAGGDLDLVAGRDIRNEASDIAAANNVMLDAGRDVVNALRTSNYEAGQNVAVTLTGPYYRQQCGKNSCSSVYVGERDYTETHFEHDEENILAPARIASLYGDIGIDADRDFVSQGSEISSGLDLTIDAGAQAGLTSYVDDERNFIRYQGSESRQRCGKNGCSNYSVAVTITEDDFVLATATSNLVGRSVSITSGDDLTLIGARIFASQDLDLTSTGGSVLIESTDLPDTIALDRSNPAEFVELTDDLVGQIFGPASGDDAETVAGTTADYIAFLRGSDLLTAVEALRRAESGADIRNAARGVGVQGYVSLIDSDVLVSLRAAANDALAAVHNSIGAQIDDHNAALADYNARIRADLAEITDLLEGTYAERSAARQDELDQINSAYRAAKDIIEDTYQAALAANQAQYGHLLTRQERRSRRLGSGRSATTQYYYVTVPDTYYVNLKNAADQNASSERRAAINAATTGVRLDRALARASYTDTALATQIADLKSEFENSLATRAAAKAVLYGDLNTALSDAIRKIELVIEQEAQEAGLRGQAIARGTVQEGEASLAASLTSQEFGNLNQIDTILVDGAGIVQNTAPDQFASVVRLDFTRSDTGTGILARDGAEERGYILYVEGSARVRFGDIPSSGSDRFIAVTYDATRNRWYYDNNNALVAFTPRSGDRLVARVDFAADTVEPLDGVHTVIGGIAAGYSHSDLSITANQWNGAAAAGEFGITLTYLEFADPEPGYTEHLDFTRSDTGLGILARDGAAERGYILYVEGSARVRFGDIPSSGSDRFIAVTYDATRDRWYYDNNNALVAFTPRSGDRLVARVDFAADTVEQLDGVHTVIGGIAAGYSNSDLSIAANQWNGAAAAGEFGITLTYLEFADPEPGYTEHLDFTRSDTGLGILVRDGAAERGYILYVEGSAHGRFDDIPSSGSDRFIAVTYDATRDRWYYDNNNALVAFTPRSGDRLVARVDFAADTVEPLDGVHTVIGGIAAGYSHSDLSIAANQWNGAAAAGEFGITLTYLEFADPEPGYTDHLDFTRSDTGTGILARDGAEESGYILYVEGSAHARFDDIPSSGSDRFIAVTYDAVRNRWYYDNNNALVAFTPRSGDRLVARVDFAADTVEPLDGVHRVIGGIAAGYSHSDLSIAANQWNGAAAAGEFGITLTYLEFGKSNALLSSGKDEQDAFLAATAWRFATHGALQSQSPRNRLVSQSDLSITAQSEAHLGQGSFDAFGRLNVTSPGGVIARSADLSGSRVDITAGGDVTGYGVDLDAINDINIFAAGDVDIAGLGRTYTDETGFEYIFGTLADESWPGQRVGGPGPGTRIMVSQELSGITSGRDLTINALGDLTLGGVTAAVAGDVTLTTNANLALTAPRSVIEYHVGDGNNGTDLWDVRSHVTDFTTGGDFSAMAGDTAFLEGARIGAGGTLDLAARNDVTISAAQDIYEYNRRTYSRSLLRRRRSSHSILRLIHDGADLTSGATMGITSQEGNLITAGSRFESLGGDINLSATQGDVLAGVFTDIDREHSEYRKSSFFGLISSSGTSLVDHRNATGTSALANLDLTIVSGGDTELVGAQLSAGRDLNLDVGGDLRVAAAIDSTREEFFESRMGAVLATTRTERSHRETAVLTSLSANGELTISVGGDTYLTLYSHEGGDGQSAAGLYPEELTALANLILLDEELLDEYFYDETKSLSPAFTAVLSIALTAGYGSLLSGPLSSSAAASGLVSTSASGVTSLTTAGKAVAAFAASSTVGLANGAVSGDLDLGEILQNAALAAGTQFLTASINLRIAGDGAGADALAEAGEAATEAAGRFGNPSYALLGGTWSESFTSGLLFEGGQLNAASVLEGAFDATLSTGLSSAVTGSDFREGLTTSLVRSVVALGLADAQNRIGNIFEGGANGGEGSLRHALLHGIAGCAAAEASGADCGAGAAAGIAGAIYSGLQKAPELDEFGGDQEAYQAAYNVWRSDLLEQAELIGATAGYLFSGGDADNVSVATTVGTSAVANNYLTHAQLSALESEILACSEEEACVRNVVGRYTEISAEQQHRLAMCGTDIACMAPHLQAIAAARPHPLSVSMLARAGLRSTALGELAYQAEVAYFGYTNPGWPRWLTKWTTPDFQNIYLAYPEWAAGNCGGLTGSACMAEFQSVANRDLLLQGAGLGATVFTISATAGAAITIAPEAALLVRQCVSQPICWKHFYAGAGEAALGLTGATAGQTFYTVGTVGSLFAGKLILKSGDEILEVIDDLGRSLIPVSQTTEDAGRFILKDKYGNIGYLDETHRFVVTAPNTGIDGIWNQGRFTPIQRGNAIEDHLAGTDYNGWTRVGSQNNGFSPAWDFNQGSTWVSLKTVNTGGSGWQTAMRSHIRELRRWSSPTNPNAAKVLDIRVQPGGATSARFLVKYGASRGVQVRINEF